MCKSFYFELKKNDLPLLRMTVKIIVLYISECVGWFSLLEFNHVIQLFYYNVVLMFLGN